MSIFFGNYEPSEIEPMSFSADIVIQFRPSSNWKGIGYGFDWMRIGDYKEVLEKAGADPTYAKGDIPYKELVTRQFRVLPEGFDTSIPGQKIENSNESLVLTSETFDYTFYQDREAQILFNRMESDEYDFFNITYQQAFKYNNGNS